MKINRLTSPLESCKLGLTLKVPKIQPSHNWCIIACSIRWIKKHFQVGMSRLQKADLHDTSCRIRLLFGLTETKTSATIPVQLEAFAQLDSLLIGIAYDLSYRVNRPKDYRNFVIADQMPRTKCPKPYGVSHELRTVPDENMKATSAVNENVNASHARLHNPTSAWCALPSDSKRVLTILLGGKNCLFGYAIQGDPAADNFVTKFEFKRRMSESSNFDKIATEQVVSEFLIYLFYFFWN